MVVGYIHGKAVKTELPASDIYSHYISPDDPLPEFPPRKPILVFDGDCAFCRAWSRRIARWTRGTVDCVTLSQAVDRFPQLAGGAFDAVRLLDTDGRVYQGAEAIWRSLAFSPRRGGAIGLWIYQNLPCAARLNERIYRWIARRRHRISGACNQ